MVDFAEPLNRDRLARLLDERGVNRADYSLTGSDSEGYVMDHRGSSWVVYYFERGRRRGVETFASEDLACRRIADLLWAADAD